MNIVDFISLIQRNIALCITFKLNRESPIKCDLDLRAIAFLVESLSLIFARPGHDLPQALVD